MQKSGIVLNDLFNKDQSHYLLVTTVGKTIVGGYKEQLRKPKNVKVNRKDNALS